MQDVTLWSVFNKKKEVYEFNHLQIGLCKGEYPIPNLDKNDKPYKTQLAWENGKWEKEFAKLENGVVIHS